MAKRSSPLFLSYDYCIYQPYSCPVVKQFTQLVTTIEELVTHNSRTHRDIEYMVIEAEAVCLLGDILPHYLTPILRQATLSNLSGYIGALEKLLEDLAYGFCACSFHSVT